MEGRAIRRTTGAVLTILGLCVDPAAIFARDAIEMMLQSGQVPADMTEKHGYSDFTDPLGRFLDLLAAGAFPEARTIQPAACATWLATRQNSAFSGKLWIWNTEINLDTLCAPG